jgi:hypothetical protein
VGETTAGQVEDRSSQPVALDATPRIVDGEAVEPAFPLPGGQTPRLSWRAVLPDATNIPRAALLRAGSRKLATCADGLGRAASAGCLSGGGGDREQAERGRQKKFFHDFTSLMSLQSAVASGQPQPVEAAIAGRGRCLGFRPRHGIGPGRGPSLLTIANSRNRIRGDARDRCEARLPRRLLTRARGGVTRRGLSPTWEQFQKCLATPRSAPRRRRVSPWRSFRSAPTPDLLLNGLH